MNSKFINVLMFAAGAAIGSAVTWKFVKTRYERIAREEIESVKEVFADRLDNSQEQDEDCDAEDESERQECAGQINWEELEDLDDEDDEYDPSDEDLIEYANLINKYTSEKGGAEAVVKKPYVISPYDFGELDDYKQFELTYYADGVLEDEDYDIVTDVDELLGEGSLDTFGEYEDDAVFVRNEYLCADFQILKDPRTYEEVRGTSPNKVSNE